MPIINVNTNNGLLLVNMDNVFCILKEGRGDGRLKIAYTDKDCARYDPPEGSTVDDMLRHIYLQTTTAICIDPN